MSHSCVVALRFFELFIDDDDVKAEVYFSRCHYYVHHYVDLSANAVNLD